MRGNRMKTRAVSFLLALAMILTMVPAQNLQAAEPAGEQPAISTQNEEPTEEKEASFGWDLTFTSLPEGGAWTWQADALTDYTARISAAQEEAENRLPAKEQTLTLTLALPEGMVLPGEISEVRFENHKDAPVSAAGDSARTGDDSPVMLYLASALLALLLAAFALLLRRRLKR